MGSSRTTEPSSVTGKLILRGVKMSFIGTGKRLPNLRPQDALAFLHDIKLRARNSPRWTITDSFSFARGLRADPHKLLLTLRFRRNAHRQSIANRRWLQL